MRSRDGLFELGLFYGNYNKSWYNSVVYFFVIVEKLEVSCLDVFLLLRIYLVY